MSLTQRIGLIAAGALVVALAACSPVTESPAPESSADASTNEGIQVDKGGDSVVITLPAAFFEGMSAEDIEAAAEEQGYTDTLVNEDGSVTYTIPKDVHDKALTAMSDQIDATIEKTLADEPSILDITHDSGYTSYEVTADRAAFEASFSASLVGFTLAMSSMFYLAFDGVPTEDQRVEVLYLDAATGEQFGSYVLPDALEQQ